MGFAVQPLAGGQSTGQEVEEDPPDIQVDDLVFVKNKNTAGVHCKDTTPKILNKYSQKRNCVASVLHIHVSVSNSYILTIDLPILLQGNMWTDPWEYINLSQTHECGYWD